MSDIINFSDNKYLEILKSLEGTNGNGDVCELSAPEAFVYLIKVVPNGNLVKEDLDNLLLELQRFYKEKYGIRISVEECFSLLQEEERKLTIEAKRDILEIAYKLIESGKTLGNKTVNDGKINTSVWLSHSLYVAKFAKITAEEIRQKQGIGLDTDKIQALAILHDYGRKYDHTLGHVVRGAEILIDDDKPHAAVAAVMHSFLAGKRCANNERAVPGFYMDENGNEAWVDDTQPDDIRKYLELHNLSIGDLILNLGDLVATDKGVVRLSDRLKDIVTRRDLDPQNREYFLLQVIKSMTYILNKMQVEIPQEILKGFPRPGDGVIKADETIAKLSDILYLHYEKIAVKKPKSTDDNDDGNR